MQKLCFASKVEVLRACQSKRHHATVLHRAVAVVDVEANAGAALTNILCTQTAYYCYCVRTLIANVFFAFDARLHFTCILSIVPVWPRWLQGLLLSTDRVKMRILYVQIAYFAKTVKNANPISTCVSRVT